MLKHLSSRSRLETAAIVVLGLFFGGALLLTHTGHTHMVMAEHSAGPSATPQQFDSHHVGLKFTFPAGYAQELRHINEDQPDEYHMVVLVKGATTTPEGSDGPPAITIAGIDIDASTNLEEWVKSDRRSNFYLSSDQKLTPTTIDGEPAVSYHYTGLYENDAIVVKHRERMFVFNVAWMEASDQIRQDFGGIIRTLSYND